MKYTVGKYVIVPEKPFSSMEKAVQYIQGAYPELDKETIEKYLNPKVESDGINKSDHSFTKSEKSESTSTENSTGGIKSLKHSQDKSR